MSASHSYSLYGLIAMLRLFHYIFAHEFLFKTQFDLEPDYIIRKGIRQRIQRCNLRREILSTFHTRVDNRSIHHFCIVFTPNCPFPFNDHHQNLMAGAAILTTVVYDNVLLLFSRRSCTTTHIRYSHDGNALFSFDRRSHKR